MLKIIIPLVLLILASSSDHPNISPRSSTSDDQQSLIHKSPLKSPLLFQSSHLTFRKSFTTEFLETQKLSSKTAFPFDPSDGDYMCRGKATKDGYAQPCDMYVVIPGSDSLRSDTNGFSFLQSPGYIIRLIIIGLPCLALCFIMFYCSINCCWSRREVNSRERCADKCLFNLTAWEYDSKDPDLMPPHYIKVPDFPRKGIADSACFHCWVPAWLVIGGVVLLSWMSTAAFSGVEVTGIGFCSLDTAVRNYADTLESTRDAYSLVDPNVPPIYLGGVNKTNGPTPPELLNILVGALRKGIVNIEGWCPSHGNTVPMESTAYDDALPVDGSRNEEKSAVTSSGVYGSRLAHEPMIKFLLSSVTIFTIFPLLAILIGFCKKSRPSLRAAMRSGTFSLSLIALLSSTSIVIGIIESDTCPTITNRIEHGLISSHSNLDPFIINQMSLMVRCNTKSMHVNGSKTWKSVDPNDSIWSSELHRIKLMVARTKEEQKARAETPSSDETSQEKSQSADDVNIKVRHQEALVKWLEQTVNCNAFSTSYEDFIVSVCGTGFGWFEQSAVSSLFLSILISIGLCYASSADYLIEQEERRSDPKGLPVQTHSSLLGSSEKSKKYWPSL
jgi:hypothetical protein